MPSLLSYLAQLHFDLFAQREFELQEHLCCISPPARVISYLSSKQLTFTVGNLQPLFRFLLKKKTHNSPELKFLLKTEDISLDLDS